MDTSSASSDGEWSSDEELQVALKRGKLKPGLVVRAPSVSKTYTNNVTGLQEKFASFANDWDWVERMDVISPGTCTSTTVEDPNDDLKREMHFYHQAQSATLVGLRKLEELGVATKRPEDYFAEMVKADDHMRRVRETLLKHQKALEEKEKGRKLREMKKFGKKVQQEVLQQRRSEKKSITESLKKFRKGKGEKPRFLSKPGDDEETLSNRTHDFHKSKGPKRKQKDKHFGFGGKKKWAKSNTAKSSADMTNFRSSKHSKASKKKRPGKTQRSRMKKK